MEDIIFSSYKIVKNAHNATITVRHYLGLLATIGAIFSLWLWTLIPISLLFIFLNPLNLPWYIFVVLSIPLTFLITKKFLRNIWSIDLLIFDKKGFFVAGDVEPILLHYSDVKTIEIHEVKDRKLYRLHFIMQKGEVIVMNILCGSQEILEEIVQLIISQSLSENLVAKKVSDTTLRRIFDNLFSSRLNRKNYIVGMLFVGLLLIDLCLLATIYNKFATNPIIDYTLFISFFIIVVFYFSLILRRRHDIGFAINEFFLVADNPIPWYLNSFPLWWTIKLFFTESSRYENQYGKTPDQYIDLRKIVGLQIN